MDIMQWTAVVLAGIIVHFYLVAYMLLLDDYSDGDDDGDPIGFFTIRLYAWMNVPFMLTVELVYIVDSTVTALLTTWDHRSISAGFEYFTSSYGDEWYYSHSLPYRTTKRHNDE